MATYRYGFGLRHWQKAKEQARQVLIDRARRQHTIAYSELVQHITIFNLDPDSYAFAAMLEEISRDEDAAGRGMLSVIVVHKDGDTMPGAGFFNLAQELGRDISDKQKSWIAELKFVFRAWIR